MINEMNNEISKIIPDFKNKKKSVTHSKEKINMKKQTLNAAGLTMQEAFEKHRNERNEFLTQAIKYNRKQKRKETILVVFIIIFILVVSAMLLKSISDRNEDAFNSCIEAGHSEQRCSHVFHE